MHDGRRQRHGVTVALEEGQRDWQMRRLLPRSPGREHQTRVQPTKAAEINKEADLKHGKKSASLYTITVQ